MKELIIVTGCSGQLGGSILKYAEKKGCEIFGIDLKIKKNSKNLYEGDVKNRLDIKLLLDKIKTPDNYDNISFINNAGVAIFSPSEERTLDEFNRVMGINLFGPIACITEFANWILRNNLNQNNSHFSVINIGSIYGTVSPDSRIYSDTSRNSSEVYGASKAGLIQITKYFAVKYAKIPIFINCVSPGGILNKELQGPEFIENYSYRVPLNSLCEVEEIASFIVNLSKNKNKYLTGQNIIIDGGLTSW